MEVININYLEENYPNYDCDEFGNVFKNGELISPFVSNNYLQVCLFDADHIKHTVGVHTVIAMKYLDYYPGCIVHHIDENRSNNNLNNLQVMSLSEHSRQHGLNNAEYLREINIGKIPVNKGKKMSEEFCRHCSESAKRRWHPEEYS